MKRINQMVDVKNVPPDIQNFQDERKQRNAAKHHIGQVAKERGDKQPHFRSMLAHLVLRSPFDPALEGGCGFCLSKTTNGRSPIFPYSCLCLSVSGGGGGEGTFVAGDGDVLGGEELGEGDSCNNASNCSRAAGGKSPFFKSASSSARSFGPSFPGWKRRSFAP